MPTLDPHNAAALSALPLEAKLQHATEVLQTAYAEASSQPVIAWTGGKDSTLLLWLAKELMHSLQLPPPRCVYIDDGDVFPEITQIVDALTEAWRLDLLSIRNEDLLSSTQYVGQCIPVSTLSKENQLALQEIGHTEDYFCMEPESPAGSHLTKTLPLRHSLAQHGITHLCTAIRWDEQPAREQEAFVVPDLQPAHTRIHPLLHLRERDVWDAILQHDIPFCPLYRYGYRSLGAMSSTDPVGELPAWEQDLEHTSERAGRGQEKEEAMAQLRSLGYM